jgi:hypothetical protein
MRIFYVATCGYALELSEERTDAIMLLNKREPRLMQFGTWVVMQLLKKHISPMMTSKIIENMALTHRKQLV